MNVDPWNSQQLFNIHLFPTDPVLCAIPHMTHTQFTLHFYHTLLNTISHKHLSAAHYFIIAVVINGINIKLINTGVDPE